jgi:hypothetical protein
VVGKWSLVLVLGGHFEAQSSMREIERERERERGSEWGHELQWKLTADQSRCLNEQEDGWSNINANKKIERKGKGWIFISRRG